MALKLSLKPGEKIFIGGAVVQNGDQPVELNILNDVPLLREKDILTEEEADTPCRRVYMCVQLMYMDQAHLYDYQQKYRLLIDDLLAKMPDTVDYLAEINNFLACGRYYQALKCARRLVDFEQELSHGKQHA
ncbi:MAG: flagellar biosynthesis repressor FlbT [Methylophilaceae bacterium]|nr:flagellar biosynthesis repressor FlbT [Methylophilaceae bacterium]